MQDVPSNRSPIKELQENPISFDDGRESQVAEIVLSHKLSTSLSPVGSPRGSGRTSPRKHRSSNTIQLNESNDSYGFNSSGMSGQFLDSDDDDEGPMTLGCIWSIVLNQAANGNPISTPKKRRHIKKSDESKKPDELLSWAAQRLRSLGYNNVNTGEGSKYRFSPQELALLALIHSFRPDLVDYDQLDPKDRKANASKLIQVLEELGIDCFLYKQGNDGDINLRVKRKDLLTQIAALKLQLDNSENNSYESLSFHLDKSQVNPEEEEIESDEVKARDIIITFDDEENGLNEENDLNKENGLNEENIKNRDEAFVGNIGEGDNLQYAGREFCVTIDVEDNGQSKRMALVMVPDSSYLNPAGRKIAIAEPYADHDVRQRFVFGKAPYWTTVIDSKAQQGMVWDVADEINTDPPEGTPFYLFPFHGRHNQHFIYRDDNRIIATQNGHAVTYVGGQKPFVMKKVSEDLKPQQTFHLEFFS